MQNLFNKKNFITFILSLFSTSLMSDRASAIIYDFNVTLDDGANTGTLIGTIETVPGTNAEGLGDYANGDFVFGDYEIELTIGADTFTQTPSNSNLVVDDLEVGDLTANSSGLFLDFRSPASGSRDLFDITSNSGDGNWGFQSFFSGGSTSYTSIMDVNGVVVFDTSEINLQLGTAREATAVPFEFSPTQGICVLVGLGGYCRLKKRNQGKNI